MTRKRKKKLIPKRRNTRSTTNATKEEDLEARIDAEIDRFLAYEENDCPTFAEADDEAEEDIDVEEEVDVGVGVEEETCGDLSVLCLQVPYTLPLQPI
ncbi:unnamed protein product [Cochlearia groenlandica]